MSMEVIIPRRTGKKNQRERQRYRETWRRVIVLLRAAPALAQSDGSDVLDSACDRKQSRSRLSHRHWCDYQGEGRKEVVQPLLMKSRQ